MSEQPYTPDEFNVRMAWVTTGIGPEDDLNAEFDRWLDGVRAAARREGQAEGMRSTANWLEGGTPRAYGFQHPCDPPGVRWEPSGDERRLLYAVDEIREAAGRVESGAGQ